MAFVKALAAVVGAAACLVSLSISAGAQDRDSYPGEGRMSQRGPYDQGYGDPRGRRDNYRQQDEGDRRDASGRRDERGHRGGNAALQQQVQAAQARHNQGVVALQQQFNQHQISRAQMDAEIRNLEVRMNSEIQQAQRR